MMAGQVTGKETVRNMEYLLKLLQNEWECSGRTKAQASLNPEDAKEVGARLAEEIKKRQGQLDRDVMTFRHSMELSKENYILLRLAKKIKKAADKAEGKEGEASFIVDLDREEYNLFSLVMQVQEVCDARIMEHSKKPE